MADQTKTQREQAHDHFQNAIARYSASVRETLDHVASEAISDYLQGRSSDIYAIADDCTPIYYSEITLAFACVVSGEFGYSDVSAVAEYAINEEGPFRSETEYMQYTIARAYERAISERTEEVVDEIATVLDVAGDLADSEDEADEDRAITLAVHAARVHNLTIEGDLRTGDRDRVLAVLSGHVDLADVFQ